MADFKKFLPTLLKHEGGWVDHPSDPGGKTNKGVTIAVFQANSEKLLSIEPTVENLKALTNEQAGILYKKLYWDTFLADEFPVQELAEIVFDFNVNAGSNALKILQRVLNGMGADIAEDGIFGKGSLAALKSFDAIDVYQNYKQARKDFYINLCEKNSKFEVFRKGWLNRVDSFPDLR